MMFTQWISLEIAWNKGENDEIRMENYIVGFPYLSHHLKIWRKWTKFEWNFAISA